MNTIFFVASKVFWFFVDPGNILFFLVGAGAILSWSSWKRTSRWLVSLAAVYSLVVITIPAGDYAYRYLENRFPANPTLPDKVDGIIVLGGTVNQFVSHARGQISLNGSVERLTVFSQLALQYPQARLIFSGGSGVVTDQSLKEADYIAPILKQLGVSPHRVIFENQSRNTYENVIFSQEKAIPKPDETWVLVTSAKHIPRAVGSFRAAGWANIIPYPVDFVYKGDEIFGPPLSLRSGLSRLARALNEWLGLLAYYLTGKTDSFLPAP